MAIDITSASTHEDIVSAVDAIIEDRQGDAALIAEERDKPVGDMTAETESGSDETAPEGEKTWLDDELKEELSAYGIDEQELAEFSSREEVERALRFLDKSALEAGRKKLAEGDGETPTRDTSGRFTKPEAAPTEETKEGTYEIRLDREIYDEGLIEELTRMRDHYETRLGALESRLAQADVAAYEQQFDQLVDSLGHADLFGTTGKENAKQLQRRQDLLVAVKAQQLGLQALGRGGELDQSLVHRVSRMVFAEDLTKKELKAKTRKIAQQSSQRLGGGATRPTDPPENLRSEMRQLYKELESAG